MTAEGVIPGRADRSPRFRVTGHMTDMDAVRIEFGVCRGMVMIRPTCRTIILDRDGRDLFMRLYFQAELQAEAATPPAGGSEEEGFTD